MYRKTFFLVMVFALAMGLSPLAALAAPPVQEAGQDYVVVADDWLSKLADKYLGNAMAYPAIVEATNQKHAEDASYAEITDPDLIEVGWKIYIPGEEATTVPDARPEDITVDIDYQKKKCTKTPDGQSKVATWICELGGESTEFDPISVENPTPLRLSVVDSGISHFSLDIDEGDYPSNPTVSTLAITATNRADLTKFLQVYEDGKCELAGRPNFPEIIGTEGDDLVICVDSVSVTTTNPYIFSVKVSDGNGNPVSEFVNPVSVGISIKIKAKQAPQEVPQKDGIIAYHGEDGVIIYHDEEVKKHHIIIFHNGGDKDEVDATALIQVEKDLYLATNFNEIKKLSRVHGD